MYYNYQVKCGFNNILMVDIILFYHNIICYNVTWCQIVMWLWQNCLYLISLYIIFGEMRNEISLVLLIYVHCITFSCISAKLWWARSFDTSASHEPGCYIVSVSTVKLISFQHFITGNKFWSEWSVGREGKTHLENFFYFLFW